MLIKCAECGKQISDSSKSCIHCGFVAGTPLQNVNQSVIINQGDNEYSKDKKTVADASMVLGIISIVMLFLTVGTISFILSLIGLILGLVGLKRYSGTVKYRSTAITGIILNSIVLLLSIVIVLFVTHYVFSFVSELLGFVSELPIES